MSTPSNKSTHDALHAALDDLHVRTVVEETVKSLVSDVELAVSLQQECQRHDQISHLQRQALAAHVALQEAQLLREDEQEERTQLANAFVKELWQVSQELGSLKRWKQSQQDTIQERDLLTAKLLQATEEIEQLKLQKTVVVSSTETATASREAVAAVSEATAAKAVDDDEAKPVKSEPEAPASDDGDVSAEAITDGDPDAKPAAEEKPTAPKDSSEEDSSNPQTEEPAAPAVSLLIEDDEDEPLLETFEESILLQVFSFLDALEIVNLAQVNIALYSRVDSLFGIGEDSSSSPVPTEIQTPAAAPAQATIVQLPPETTAKKPEPKPAPTGGLIGLFQTNKASAVASRTPAKSPAPSSATTQRSAPLSAAMANSMAEKLTDKEINAIISMTEKLNQRNVQVDQLKHETIELKGKLDGTEAIKNFLVQKVRDMEQSLSKTKDLESKTTQQIASDQEVISFLDSRVRELERAESMLLAQSKSVSDQLLSLEISKDKKITVLSDMLQYERQRLEENERDYKATRKVLVKEVKSCRSTILTLQAERDGLHEQNERLKRALLATSHSSSSNGGL